MYKKISWVLKKNTNLSTTSVYVKTDEGRRELPNKAEMENAIINENRKKYHQTESTCPFLAPQLILQFGRYGEGEATKQVLNGNFIPN